MIKYIRGDKMFKIGNIELKNNIVIAPMAGISNSAFRRIVKEMGAGLIYAEMVSDKAIIYDNEKTKQMLYLTAEERPIAQQIFGSDIESFTESAKIVYEQMKPDIIDINMGCPVPKIAIKSQAGAALLKNPDKIKEIVKSVVQAVPCPVTVKIRSGWDEKSINAKLVAKICEEAGASAITIHGRTRKQGYSGNVDLDIIKEVKESVNIPVIANGDIKDIESAKKMLECTKCDAIMIGRATLGNPWLIKKLVTYFEENIILPDPTYEEKINMALKHLSYLTDLKNEKVAILEIRSHMAWYLKGLKDSGPIKNAINQAKTIEEIKKILNNYLNYLKNSIK